jgi:fimbrial chaperone protein
MKLRALALAGALALLPAGHALARGQLQARPTLVELVPGQQAGRLLLANTGDAPVAAQVRVFAWTQVEGDDRLADTAAIAVSPAIVRIPAGGEQVVRVVRLGEVPAGQDASYRLVVDELPVPEAEAASGIEVRMRYLVPLFVRAAGAAEPALRCSLAGSRLACRNDGGRPAQLGASRLADAGGKTRTLTDGLFGYLLPGTGRHWEFETGQLAGLDGALTLETQINGKPGSVPVQRQP